MIEFETYKYICDSVTKAFTTEVRIYKNEICLHYSSAYFEELDPLKPYLFKIMNSGHEVGIITTPLFQFYAFVTLQPGIRMIIGPTCALQNEGDEVEYLLEYLQIEKKKRTAYIELLCSAPVISIERLAWMVAFMATMLQGSIFPVEKVWVEKVWESKYESVKIEYTDNKMNNLEDMGISQAIKQSSSWGRLVISYVEMGQTERLHEMFSAPPKVYVGKPGNDKVRFMKNRAVSMITNAAQAAVRGGMDTQKAFIMYDLYIQKMELLPNVASVEHFVPEMLIDFAEQVKKIRSQIGFGSQFFQMCTQYISQNIFSVIRTEDMAQELGYSRAYLCTRFKQEAGESLTQYIQQKKIEEAKELLQFSEHNLSEIANLLRFSSQSHFQTVFKKVTGETPLSYRKRKTI